jgi:hypothetical protein
MAITFHGRSGTHTLELRDQSPTAVAELWAAVHRLGGQADGNGPSLHVRADSPNVVEAIYAQLQNDPRGVSPQKVAVQEAQQRLAEQEALRKADRVAQLEAQVAEQAARIAEMERR